MLHAIQRYFSEKLATESADADPEHSRRLATAALMVEALRADEEIEAEERETALAGLGKLFDLSPDNAKELLTLAEQEADEGTSLFQFTHLIDRHYSREDKFRVIEMMWQVAYADGHKDAREEHLVRKVADLLHLPHSEFIRARLRVEERARGR
jgi:uncharacterized tellurite resistance protein B-like protein